MINNYLYLAGKEIWIWDDLVVNAVEGKISVWEIIPYAEIYLFTHALSKNKKLPSIRLADEIRADFRLGESIPLKYVGEWFNHDFNDDKHCRVCGKPIRQRKRGRPKKYCSKACKQFATRQKEYMDSFVPREQQTSTFNDLGHMGDDMMRTNLINSDSTFLDNWGIDNVSELRNDNYWGVGSGLLLGKSLTDKVKEYKAIDKELRRIYRMPKNK